MGEIGVQSAVFVDGNDVTEMLNMASLAGPMGTADVTTFRTPGFARRFNATLRTQTIQTKGFLPVEYDEAIKLLSATIGNRAGQDVLIGVGGLDVGNLAILAKSIKTTAGAEMQADGIMAMSADFQVTAASPGACAGLVLTTPHGSSSLTANETQTLVFTNVPAGQQFAFRKDGTLSASWTAADSNTTRDTRLESLYGSGTLTVTGSLTTSSDGVTGETLYSGTLTLVYAGSAAATDVDQVEVVTGESNRILVASGDSGNYVYDGVTWTLAQSAATIQTAFRNVGGNLTLANVKGTATAPVSGNLATGGTAIASTTHAGSAAGNAYDGDIATYWYSQAPVSLGVDWLGYDRGSGNAVAATSYTVKGLPPGGFGPRGFTFRGSNDGSTWTNLDTQTAQDTWTTAQTYNFTNTTAYRYYSLLINAIRDDESSYPCYVSELSFSGATAAGTAGLGVYYPPALGNVTLPSVTGTGITRSTREQGGGLSTGIVPATTVPGFSTDAIYNPVSATGNGTAVTDGAADTTYGAIALLQCIEASGAGKSLSVKIQHAPDDEGSPGSWSDLQAFDAVTAKGAQRKTIAAGVTIHPHLRAVVTAITGSFVYSVVFARFQS